MWPLGAAAGQQDLLDALRPPESGCAPSCELSLSARCDRPPPRRLVAGQEVESKKPVVVKYGINHITQLVESGKAQCVVIAHDVDPIELVVWLPALCKKMGVPYCIVKGKARLGTVVHKKTATALALTAVKNEDQREFAKLVESFKVGAGPGGGARLAWGAAGQSHSLAGGTASIRLAAGTGCRSRSRACRCQPSAVCVSMGLQCTSFHLPSPSADHVQRRPPRQLGRRHHGPQEPGCSAQAGEGSGQGRPRVSGLSSTRGRRWACTHNPALPPLAAAVCKQPTAGREVLRMIACPAGSAAPRPGSRATGWFAESRASFAHRMAVLKGAWVLEQHGREAVRRDTVQCRKDK